MGSFLELSAITLSFKLEGTPVSAIPLLIAVVIGLFLLVPAALFRKHYFYRRRLKKNIITAEYEAPLGLNPAEIGYLFDGKLREQEVGAVVIHMVQSGLLHVRKINGQKRIFAGPRIDESIKTYEKKLFDEADVPEGVTADQLLGRFTTRSHRGKKTVTFGSKEFIFSQLVHADLKRRGYVKGSYGFAFLWATMKITVLLQCILLVIPIGVVYYLASLQQGTFDTSLLMAAILMIAAAVAITLIPFFIAAAVVACVRGKILGREWIITDKLERLWPQIVGFKQYIQLVEADSLHFHSEHLEKTIKNDTLPYAVALGYVKNWRKIIS